jgi:O-methyltransferase involved in polyketide biosynthesis
MDEERPSRTAEHMAILRALHQTLDAEPKILNDPIAVGLVDPSSDFYKAFVHSLEEMPAASTRPGRRPRILYRRLVSRHARLPSAKTATGNHPMSPSFLSWAASLRI